MSLARKKEQEYAGDEESMMLKKLSQFLYLRGFESELIHDILFTRNTADE
jgi:SOS response regulatory protein OraA/RecX